MIEQALKFFKNNPNVSIHVRDAVLSTRVTPFHDAEEERFLQAEVAYHIQQLVCRQPNQWKCVGKGETFAYIQHRVETFEDVRKLMLQTEEDKVSFSSGIQKGFPISAFDMHHLSTQVIINRAIEDKMLYIVTPGHGTPRRYPAQLIESHPWIDILHYSSTIQCSPAKGTLELRIKQTDKHALSTIEVRSSCPKINITPLLQDVKPGTVVQFTLEGKICCECVLRVSIDVSDKLVLPLKVLDTAVKSQSMLYLAESFTQEFITKSFVSNDFLYQWHVQSNTSDDNSRKMSKFCVDYYTTPDDEPKSIVPEEAINAASIFQRPPTNIHMRLFHPRLLQICKSSEAA